MPCVYGAKLQNITATRSAKLDSTETMIFTIDTSFRDGGLRTRTCLVLLLLLNIISTRSVVGENTYATTHNTNSWALASGGDTVKDTFKDSSTLNDNTYSDGRSTGRNGGYHVEAYEIHINEVRERMISTTILMKLSPFEDEIDADQTKVYENGLNKFLTEKFGSDDYDLDILDVAVIQNKIVRTNDRQQIYDEEDHILYIESVVSAQNTENSTLSSESFGEIVLKYCSNDYNDLIQSWQMEEVDTIDTNDDHYEDHMVFGHVLEMDAHSIFASETNSEGREVIGVNVKIMLAISVSIVTACIIFCCYTCIRGRKTQRKIYNIKKDWKDVIELPYSTPLKCVLSKSRNGVDYDIVYKDDSKSITIGSSEDVQPLYPLPRESKKHINTPIQQANRVNIIDEGIIVKPYEALLASAPPISPLQADNFYTNERGTEEHAGSACSSITSNTMRWRPLVEMECYAPAGKVGVSIDTVDGRPVVYNIKKDSPVFGVLQPLDIIVGVDEVDTSSMSATKVTVLMAKRIRKRRKITFMRGGDEKI